MKLRTEFIPFDQSKFPKFTLYNPNGTTDINSVGTVLTTKIEHNEFLELNTPGGVVLIASSVIKEHYYLLTTKVED